MKKPRILNVQTDTSIPWFDQIKKTVVLPGDSEHKTFYAIKPSDYVTILAQTTEEKIVIVKQYRPVVEDFTFEFPSGHMEKGETPAQAVIRELKEETNCIARDVILLGEIMPDTGRLENRLWAFYSQDIDVNQFPDPAENEGIKVSLVTVDELFKMINDGIFNHALDLCVIALAMSKRYLRI
jgi:8-oxo-dGTP pyrophosphatase MutT (NUDIX family)